MSRSLLLYHLLLGILEAKKTINRTPLMSHECFEVSIEDKIAHVILNRPEKRNSMNPAFWKELPEIIKDIDYGSKARVIVLSSTGQGRGAPRATPHTRSTKSHPGCRECLRCSAWATTRCGEDAPGPTPVSVSY